MTSWLDWNALKGLKHADWIVAIISADRFIALFALLKAVNQSVCSSGFSSEVCCPWSMKQRRDFSAQLHLLPISTEKRKINGGRQSSNTGGIMVYVLLSDQCVSSCGLPQCGHKRNYQHTFR